MARISTVFFFLSAALERPAVTTIAVIATAAVSRVVVHSRGLRIFFLLSVFVLSEDRLDQIPNVCVDVLERLFVRGPDLFRGPLDSRRVFDVPVEGHRLGWRRWENSLGFFGQRHDDLVMIQIRYLTHGFGSVA